jgi:alpha-beta hydrolase superfamily lysophospholipase
MAKTPDRSPTEEYLEGRGGLRIFVRSWRPQAQARAVVVICHGVNSHSGQYVWAAEQFANSGFAVYALDLRGRGKSDGERFYVDTIDDYVSDLAQTVELAKAREAGLPLFLLGHSAGGVVSCTYTLDNQGQLDGLICESFAFQVYAPDFALAVLKGLSHLAPHAHVLRLRNEDFSRDPVVVEALNSDPLIKHEVQPTSTVAALARADERLKESFHQITLPVFILHGSADKATRPSGSQFFFDTVGSTDKTLKLYPDHFHDLLSDYGKETVIADMKSWVEARLDKAPAGGADDQVSPAPLGAR